MRDRIQQVDPVIALMALAVGVLGLGLGLGLWGIAAGAVIVAATGGSGSLSAWARRRVLPPPGTQERALVLRSLRAAATMRLLVRSVSAGPITKRCVDLERQARSALPTIRALGLQAFRIRELALRIPIDGLEVERANTLDLLARNPAERIHVELESSLRSTEAQIATGRRLWSLAEELFARTRALVTSMEAVAVGLAELQAISASDPTAQPQLALANLSRDIDALRGGLEEAQTFGRRAAAVHLLEV
jgi:hypothetical protein